MNQVVNGHESTIEDAAKIAQEIADDPIEAAKLMAAFAGALKALEASEHVPGVMISPDHKFASLLQTCAAQNAVEFEKTRAGGLEAKFDERDLLGWVRSVFSWIKGFNKHEWKTAPAAPDSFANQTRLGLLGDWGTGLYGAPECGRSLANDPAGYGLLFHLGDVYYSGDVTEIDERFLKFWPRNETTLKTAVSRACNSNHEMYTGGKGYFSRTLEEFDQPASYFAAQNDYWLLAGLDSAYFTKDIMHNKADLNQEQVDWLEQLVAQAGDRRVILFSHHQPFSFFDEDNPLLAGKLSRLLEGGKIFAWYWGHEHRCILYDRHPVWKMYGRCAGHSGFPYFRDDLKNHVVHETSRLDTSWIKLPTKNLTPGAIMIDGPNPYVAGVESKYGVQGYMTLEFGDDQLNELVHAPDGTILYNRRLV